MPCTQGIAYNGNELRLRAAMHRFLIEGQNLTIGFIGGWVGWCVGVGAGLGWAALGCEGGALGPLAAAGRGLGKKGVPVEPVVVHLCVGPVGSSPCWPSGGATG